MLNTNVIGFAISLLGLMITISWCFFEIKSSKKIQLTPCKGIIFIFFLLGLSVNLAVLFYKKDMDHTSAFGTIDEAAASVEKLIEDYSDEIKQNKGKYINSDVLQTENRYVNLFVCENAGTIRCCSEEGSEISSELLDGKRLPFTQVVLLDYETDNIICFYNSDENGYITHYANDGDRFYCVAIAPEYELYVSEPVFVVGKVDDKYSGLIGLYLERADDEYSIPFCIRMNIRDSNQTDQYYSVLENGSVSFRCIESSDVIDHSLFNSIYHTAWTNNRGIVSNAKDNYYFELNTRYELDIQPGLVENSTNSMRYFYDSDYQTIDKIPDNSNIMELYFDYDGGKLTPYKLWELQV